LTELEGRASVYWELKNCLLGVTLLSVCLFDVCSVCSSLEMHAEAS
jgi:hypothetical protein